MMQNPSSLREEIANMLCDFWVFVGSSSGGQDAPNGPLGSNLGPTGGVPLVKKPPHFETFVHQIPRI